jgi:nucleotide-binding universal stress UspA family protein
VERRVGPAARCGAEGGNVSVVCGTDFSDYGGRALRVAACFARAFGEPLVVAHVVDLGALGWAASDAIESAWLEAARRKLDEVVAPWAAEGLAVEARVLSGTPDERLSELAGALPARLVVVGVLGRRSPQHWRVGSLAARLAQEAPAPVLMVSEAEPFEQCAKGERPLRVLVAVDFSRSSDAAVGWLATLRRLGPCDATLLHLYDPSRELARLGLPRSDAESEREVEAVLTRDLGARVGELGGPGSTWIRATPVIGWVADSLALAAEQERFDLVVVGGRRRTGLARIRHESVSNGLLRIGPPAVLRVPVAAAEAVPTAMPRVARVLAPTDLSELGNAAIPYAYAIAPAGGTVHLLHVIEPTPVPNPLYAHYTPGRRPTDEERAAQERDLETVLTALVPAEAEARGIETRFELVHSDDVAGAIATAAERLGVDAVCLGTQGRSGLSQLLTGSVTREVAERCGRPLFLVRPPRD